VIVGRLDAANVSIETTNLITRRTYLEQVDDELVDLIAL